MRISIKIVPKISKIQELQNLLYVHYTIWYSVCDSIFMTGVEVNRKRKVQKTSKIDRLQYPIHFLTSLSFDLYEQLNVCRSNLHFYLNVYFIFLLTLLSNAHFDLKTPTLISVPLFQSFQLLLVAQVNNLIFVESHFISSLKVLKQTEYFFILFYSQPVKIICN